MGSGQLSPRASSSLSKFMCRIRQSRQYAAFRMERRASVASMISRLVSPHGARALRPLQLEDDAERRRAQMLPRVRVASREQGDLVMRGIGGFTPLEGFMDHADWKRVCDEMRTADGLFWPIPITLSTDQQGAGAIRIGSEIALADPDDGSVLAVMTVREKYGIDRTHECK